MQKESVLNKSKCFWKTSFKKWRGIAIFVHFAKAVVRQNGYKIVDFGSEVLINQQDDRSARMLRKLARIIPTNMVRIRVRGNLRMRNQNTKTTVPLDVVPERRTKRFPPRFRPVGRFCELRFRYLSSPTGREGEISRPLDHMRQIPFIHSARLKHSTNFYIYRTVS